VFARVVLALARLAVKPRGGPHGGLGLPVVSDPKNSAVISYYAWPVFASVSWAAVMHLFKWHAAELQPSLRSSMTYIYADSDRWDGVRNFLWHNK
jgi:peroxisomal membrane protein 4